MKRSFRTQPALPQRRAIVAPAGWRVHKDYLKARGVNPSCVVIQWCGRIF
jgi:hypothetical protein